MSTHAKQYFEGNYKEIILWLCDRNYTQLILDFLLEEKDEVLLTDTLDSVYLI